MKFHQMSLCAFGPFAGTETVDFDALSADGLFLLRGQTGSGKTSVLDAITFALYGRVAGSREADQLKSHHAPAQRQPYVELEFSRADQRYRVYRTAVYYRPAKRAGAQPQRENTSATLHRMEHGEWVPIPAARVQEVDSELKDIVGLSLAEFTKVMLLPQGAFAQLLHSSNEERRGILEQLFDTTTYQQIEAAFWQKMREVETELSGVDSTVASHLDALRESAASLLSAAEGTTDAPANNESPGQEAQRLIDVAHEELQRLRDTAAESAKHAKKCDEEAAARALTHRQLQRWAQHAAKVQDHEALREAADRAREDIVHHDRAVDARRWLASAQQATTTAAETSAGARAAVEHAEHIIAASPDVENRALMRQDAVDKPALQAVWKSVSSLRHHLAGPESTSAEKAYEAALEQAQESKEVLTQLNQQHQACTERLSAARATVHELQSQLGESSAVDHTIDEATAALHQLQQAQNILARRDSARERCRSAQRDAQSQQEAVDSASAHYQALASGHLSSLAYELAQELADNEPCLVCGSTEHPHPLEKSTDTVSREQVEEARVALRQAEGVLHQHAARAEAAATEEAETAEELHSVTVSVELTPEEVQRAVSRQQEQLIQLRQERHRQHDLAARLTEARDEAAQAEREATAAHHAWRHQQEQCQRHHEDAATQGEAVTELRGGYETLAQRQTAVGQVETVLEDALTSADAATSAAHRAQDAAAASEKRIQELGFDNVEQVNASIQDDADYRAAQSHVHHFDTTGEQLRFSAADADTVAGQKLSADGIADPGQAAVYAAEAEAEEQRRVASADHDRVTAYASRCAVLEESGRRIHELERHRDARAAEQEAIQLLAPTLNGQGENSLKMRLTTYVLAARLEKIVESATRHLSVMTDGRYQLLLDAQRGGRGLRGLDLKVYDEFGDTERPTESLSGGETFMTALSMALGLAETVQSEAGGIDMDSLFIDEGFGSLDEHTLDSVMTALHSLQGEGRRVGVVSHVTEMHQQIPAQLRVTKTRHGSTLHLVVPQ